MKKSKKKQLPVFLKLEALYSKMQQEFDRSTQDTGFTCRDCQTNCCRSYFQHHTHVEWAYLLKGLAELPPEERETFIQNARDYMEQARQSLALGQRPNAMCPLNRDGLCAMYQHRLMICRLHGVSHLLIKPGALPKNFPGCDRYEQAVAKMPQHPPLMDRTPLYRELAALEMQFMGKKLHSLPKVDLTLAEMLLAEPPFKI